MDDQLDDDLKDHIKEVFENFEDASGDEGWLLLRKKYPEQAKRRAIAWIWLGSAAASLLLLLGILWLNYTPKNNSHLANNKKQPANNLIPKTAAPEKEHGLTDSSVINQQNQQLANNTPQPGGTTRPVKTSKQPAYRSNRQQSQSIAANIATTDHAFKNPAANVNKPAISPTITKPGIIVNTVADIPKPVTAANPAKTQSQDIISAKTLAAAKVDTGSKSAIKSQAAVSPPGVVMLQETKTNRAILSDNSYQNPKEQKKSYSKAVRFSVYATTYFNYAKGSSNQINIGAGFTTDISLTDKLKFSTGLAIAQNTLNYETQPPATNFDAAPVALHTASVGAFSSAGLYIPTAPAFKNYNASLVGLDIPFNLKYVFNPQKNNLYVSAGLSSGTFINENYTYAYSYPAPFSSNVSQEQDQSTHKSFNSFYLAKTLNFAFGVAYPLGKSNKLIVEPFLKYPLDGLGSQQLRFGAGGLNLKFNFDPHR